MPPLTPPFYYSHISLRSHFHNTKKSRPHRLLARIASSVRRSLFQNAVRIRKTTRPNMHRYSPSKHNSCHCQWCGRRSTSKPYVTKSNTKASCEKRECLLAATPVPALMEIKSVGPFKIRNSNGFWYRNRSRWNFLTGVISINNASAKYRQGEINLNSETCTNECLVT